MPKMKTKKSASKRFKFTGTGKIKRNQAFKRHTLTKKTRERKRRLRQSLVVDPSNEKQIKQMMPYGG